MAKANQKIIKSIELQPVQDALYAIGGKWKFPIIYSLCKSPKRFVALQEDVEGITPKMLTQELKELECNKLVVRTAHHKASVEYALSDYGKTLEPVLRGLQQWGKNHQKKVREK
jgi:DNA-binding HxlR family transcriptional regulator